MSQYETVQKDGFTALHVCANLGDDNIMRLLHQYHVNANIVDKVPNFLNNLSL